MNYPRIWLLPAMLGVGPEHTGIMAALLLVAFGLGLLALVPLAGRPASASLLAVALFSPVVWLAVERANSDLLVFGLLSTAGWAAARRPRLASGLVAAAAVLKLYPIFALACLCTDSRRRTLWSTLPVLGLFAIYLAAIAADLPLIRANSLRWDPIAYGIELLPRAVAAATGWPFAALLAVAVVLLSLVLAASWCWRGRRRLGAAAPPQALAAFRIGACVFVGSFGLGSNFDYRLSFLLLVVPQLVVWWGATRGPLRAAAGGLLAGVMLVVWSMTWRHWLAGWLGSEALGRWLDDVLVLALVCGLLTTVVLSLPDWLLPAARRKRPWLDARVQELCPDP